MLYVLLSKRNSRIRLKVNVGGTSQGVHRCI